MRYLQTPLAFAIGLISMGLNGEAAAESRTILFTADREACFARVYDRAHLAKNPRQKVATIHILRTLGERPDAENWRPEHRQEAIKAFQETGETNVSAFVTFRDRPGHFSNTLICDKEGPNGVRCAVECDGGSFTLRREAAGTALLTNHGFVLDGHCGEAPESIRFEPGADDRVFRLEPRAIAVCRAEEQRATPIPAGQPLRERFTEDEAFCFGRDYDAAHLKGNPQQKVATIRVGRLDPAAERAENPDTPLWLDRVKLSVSLSLRSGGARAAARYACNPRADRWECQRSIEGERQNDCADRTINLVRGPGNDIMLINRQSGLPIDSECESAKSTGQYPQNPPTRSDDRTFRLSRMPINACR